mgnify:CR=1 FL=1
MRKPKIIVEQMDRKTYVSEQVVEVDDLFIVCYDGKPFSLRSVNTLINSAPKYSNTTFSNQSHASNLVKKLNTKFNTTKFSVEKVLVSK